jgi:hypothetical protein
LDPNRAARRPREKIHARIVRLQSLRAEVDRIVNERWGGKVAQCCIMEVLADHGQCLALRHEDV